MEDQPSRPGERWSGCSVPQTAGSRGGRGHFSGQLLLLRLTKRQSFLLTALILSVVYGVTKFLIHEGPLLALLQDRLVDGGEGKEEADTAQMQATPANSFSF